MSSKPKPGSLQQYAFVRGVLASLLVACGSYSVEPSAEVRPAAVQPTPLAPQGDADTCATAPSPFLSAPIPVPAPPASTSGLAELPGTRLYYTDTGGDGEAIILLHATTGNALSWAYQQPIFAAAGYRVVTYSRRGFHESDAVTAEAPGTNADDLNNLVDYLGIDRFHLLGTAAGGGVALEYAAAHLDRVQSLIISTSFGLAFDPEFAAQFQSLRPAGFETMPAAFAELGPSYRLADPEGTARWAENAMLARRADSAEQPRGRVSWELLMQMAVPALVVAGAADLYSPPVLMAKIAGGLPNAKMVILPEVGHSAFWEAPELFNRTILDFLAALAAGSNQR